MVSQGLILHTWNLSGTLIVVWALPEGLWGEALATRVETVPAGLILE